jgi:hypothetical protein
MKELLEELKRSADRRRFLKRSMKAAGVATGAMAMGAGLRTRAVSGYYAGVVFENSQLQPSSRAQAALLA